MEQPITEPRLKAIETRQDKLESEIIEHIEHMTQDMHDSFKTVNARFDTVDARLGTLESRFDTVDVRLGTLEKNMATIRDTLTDHREIARSHGQLLQGQGAKLDLIVQLLQQKPNEEE